MTALLAFLAGGLTALLGSMVPAGLVSAEVLRTASIGRRRYAAMVGWGAGLGELPYVAAAVFGLTLLTRLGPGVATVSRFICSLLLSVIGARLILGPPLARAVQEHGPDKPDESGAGRWKGFTAGAGLMLINPSVVPSWVVVLGALASAGLEVEGLKVGLAFTLGTALGTGLWFSGLSWAVSKLMGSIPRTAGHRLQFAVGIAYCAAGLSALGNLALDLF